MHVGRKWTLFLSIPSCKVLPGRGRLPLKRTQRDKGSRKSMDGVISSKRSILTLRCSLVKEEKAKGAYF